MGKRKEKISSSIAWSTPDKISVRGLDLPNEILGHMNLGDLAFLQLTGRKATPEDKIVPFIARIREEHDRYETVRRIARAAKPRKAA